MADAMAPAPTPRLPPLRAASESRVQFSDVARFVGMNLRRDERSRPPPHRTKMRPFSPPIAGAAGGTGDGSSFMEETGSLASPVGASVRRSCSDSSLVKVQQQQLQQQREEEVVAKKSSVPRACRKTFFEIVEKTQDLRTDAHRREAVRAGLIRVTGSAQRAFKLLDINNSGCICLGDFADAVGRLGVPWKDLTGYNRTRDLFSLFDHNKNGAIDFPKLFPVESRQTPELPRLSTPEFWEMWCRKNKEPPVKKRPSKWNPAEPDAKLNILFDAVSRQEEAIEKKKWMKQTTQRLKSRGKSDARCRELVAQHLPRGTGPVDRQEVKTFTAADVRELRTKYSESVHESSRNITKMVYELRDHRKCLQTFRQEFFDVALEPSVRKEAELARKKTVNQFAGLKLLDKVRDEPLEVQQVEVEETSTSKSLPTIAKESGIEEEQVEDLFKEFIKISQKDEMLNFRGFGQFLGVLCPGRTFADSDLAAWWRQAVSTDQLRANEEATGIPFNARRTQGSFEQFVVWFASSEIRMEHDKQGRSNPNS